jgi:hypothetical protein
MEVTTHLTPLNENLSFKRPFSVRASFAKRSFAPNFTQLGHDAGPRVFPARVRWTPGLRLPIMRESQLTNPSEVPALLNNTRLIT